MRIISGKYKSRAIKTPNPKLTRPTTDKVKESLFNMLQNSFEFTSAKVLDIYAGSGSLGLEALSRGASEIHFVEKNYSVVKILSNNIMSLSENDSCKIIKRTALQFSNSPEPESYDLIFADPPFFEYDIHQVFHNIIKRNFLNKNGIFIIERSIQTRDTDVEKFGIEPLKKIGDSLIYWYET